jgi:Septum formation
VQTIALRIGFFVLIGIGAFIARPYLMGNVGDLKVGECFDTPALDQKVEDIQHHPCTEVHGGEVFMVGKHAAADGARYPKEAALWKEIESACTSVFKKYTGMNAEKDPKWSFAYFYPLKEGWAEGDRGFICYAARVDGKTTTGSIKKS